MFKTYPNIFESIIDKMDLIAQIRGIYDNYLFETEILAASVRQFQIV